MTKKETGDNLDAQLLGLLKAFPLQVPLNRKRLQKVYAREEAREKLREQMVKITALIRQPAVQAAFLRAYLRIYSRRINKDGRHGSLIMEITKRCNQGCRHCYSRARANKSMKEALIKKILALARRDYKHVFITGGEPCLDKRVFKIARSNPDIMFFMFTNGSLIDAGYARKLASLGNLIPVLSIDGKNKAAHDYFKGKGSWEKIMRAISALNSARMPWGFLSMVTNINARQILSRSFIRRWKERGAVMARYLEYIPVGQNGQKNLVPSAATYSLMEKRKRRIIAENEIYMQETLQKKCLGLLFFDVDGNIKCCPFFHYAKHNLCAGKAGPLVEDSFSDWYRAKYAGECPLYSDHQQLREHILSRGWKPTVSFNPGNAISAGMAEVMSRNYREYLRLKEKR